MPALFPSHSGGTENAGTAGDMFGGLTALFSGLAFAGLITTLLMQRRELALQRLELQQTRDVFSVQRFESTFFGLLKLFNDHVASIELFRGELTGGRVRDNERPERGRDALALAVKYLPSPFVQNKSSGNFGEEYYSDTDKPKSSEVIFREFLDYYDRFLEPNMSPYFRLLFNVFRHVELSSFSSEASNANEMRSEYMKITCSNISSSEVLLLMLYCSSSQEFEQNRLVERYGLLRHITREHYDRYPSIVKAYAPSAFMFDEHQPSAN